MLVPLITTAQCGPMDFDVNACLLGQRLGSAKITLSDNPGNRSADGERQRRASLAS
jgi:hypothetical protein